MELWTVLVESAKEGKLRFLSMFDTKEQADHYVVSRFPYVTNSDIYKKECRCDEDVYTLKNDFIMNTFNFTTTKICVRKITLPEEFWDVSDTSKMVPSHQELIQIYINTFNMFTENRKRHLISLISEIYESINDVFHIKTMKCLPSCLRILTDDLVVFITVAIQEGNINVCIYKAGGYSKDIALFDYDFLGYGSLGANYSRICKMTADDIAKDKKFDRLLEKFSAISEKYHKT